MVEYSWLNCGVDGWPNKEEVMEGKVLLKLKKYRNFHPKRGILRTRKNNENATLVRLPRPMGS